MCAHGFDCESTATTHRGATPSVHSRIETRTTPLRIPRAGASLCALYFLSPPDALDELEPPPDEDRLFEPPEVVDDPPAVVDDVPGLGTEPPEVVVEPPGSDVNPPGEIEFVGNDGLGRVGSPPDGSPPDGSPPDGSPPEVTPPDVVETPPDVVVDSFDVVMDFGGSTGAGAGSSGTGAEIAAFGAVAGPTAPEAAGEPDVTDCPGTVIPPPGTGARAGAASAAGCRPPASLDAGTGSAAAGETGETGEAAAGTPGATAAGKTGATLAAGTPGAIEFGRTATGLTTASLTTPLSTTGARAGSADGQETNSPSATAATPNPAGINAREFSTRAPRPLDAHVS